MPDFKVPILAYEPQITADLHQARWLSGSQFRQQESRADIIMFGASRYETQPFRFDRLA